MDHIDPKARTGAYEAIVNYINVENKYGHIFFDDDPMQKIWVVSLDQLAPPTYGLKDTVFSEGDWVEVRWKATSDSPYGWWLARIVRIEHGGRPRRIGYVVRWESMPEVEQFVKRIDVRPAVFKYI